MTSLPFSSHSSPIQNIFWHFLSVNQESLGHPFMIHSALIMVYFWAMWYSVLQTPSAVWLLLPLNLRYSDWRTLWQPQESWTLWGAAGAKKVRGNVEYVESEMYNFFHVFVSFHFHSLFCICSAINANADYFFSMYHFGSEAPWCEQSVLCLPCS